MSTDKTMKGLTVDADLIEDGLISLNPPASVIELANLLGDMQFRNRRKQRWAKQAYCHRFNANPRTVQRQLQWLESVGAVSPDPINRQCNPFPWKAHIAIGAPIAERTVSPLSTTNTNTNTTTTTTKAPSKAGNKEQIQKLIETWNTHKPATWAALQSWNPKRQKVVDALYQGQGGMSRFIADIPTVFGGLQFIGKKTACSRSFWLDPDQKQHHNFDTFMGTRDKLPKTNWHKALEAVPVKSKPADSLPGDPWKDHGIKHPQYAPPTPLNELDPELPLGLRRGTHSEEIEAEARRHYGFQQKQSYLEQKNAAN